MKIQIEIRALELPLIIGALNREFEHCESEGKCLRREGKHELAGCEERRATRAGELALQLEEMSEVQA